MVTTYNMKDMVSFGNYLLSDERRELYANHPEADSMPPLEDRLKHVSHADVENWKEKQKPSDLITSLRKTKSLLIEAGFNDLATTLHKEEKLIAKRQIARELKPQSKQEEK